MPEGRVSPPPRLLLLLHLFFSLLTMNPCPRPKYTTWLHSAVRFLQLRPPLLSPPLWTFSWIFSLQFSRGIREELTRWAGVERGICIQCVCSGVRQYEATTMVWPNTQILTFDATAHVWFPVTRGRDWTRLDWVGRTTRTSSLRRRRHDLLSVHTALLTWFAWNRTLLRLDTILFTCRG
jgi:hypothetical protein